MRCIRYLVTRDTVIVILLLAVAWLYAADYTKVKTWTTGDTITASGLNDDMDGIINTINDLENENVKSTAAIAYSKLNLTGGIVNSDIKSTAAIAQSKISNAARAIDAAKVDGFSAAAAATANTICVLNASANVPIYTVDTNAIENDGVTVGKLAHNIDATAIGFNADKLDSYDASELLPVAFGTWISRNAETDYDAATDGFVTVKGRFDNTAVGIGVAVDITRPGFSERPVYSYLPSSSDDNTHLSVTAPIKKGDSWKARVFGAYNMRVVYWFPLGAE